MASEHCACPHLRHPAPRPPTASGTGVLSTPTSTSSTSVVVTDGAVSVSEAPSASWISSFPSSIPHSSLPWAALCGFPTSPVEHIDLPHLTPLFPGWYMRRRMFSIPSSTLVGSTVLRVAFLLLNTLNSSFVLFYDSKFMTTCHVVSKHISSGYLVCDYFQNRLCGRWDIFPG